MNRRDTESGVAFILVLTVLLGLIVLAAPFLTVALNDSAVSESVIAVGQVEAGTSALLKYGAWWLERTTEAGERRKGGDPDSDIFATPEYDVEEEFAIPIDLAGDKGTLLVGSEGGPLMSRLDPRGETWDLKVRDEQSIPNMWSAPPFLLSASLGRSINTADLKVEDSQIDLEDGKDFPLANGAIWIDGERITYTKREGNTLLGCARGAPGGGKARTHKAETYVLDDRARELSMLPFKSPRAKGGWREPVDPSAVKEISLYGDGVFSAIDADRLARDFAVANWRITGEPFGPAQTLRQPIDPLTADVTDGFKITVKSNDGINAGTLVRITDGVNTEYGFVVASNRRGTQAVLTLAEVTKNAYAERRTSVAPLVRHPVNVNTASRDTLERCMLGLQITGGRRDQGKQGRVTTASAKLVAEQLISNRPIKDLEQLRDILLKAAESAPLIFTQPEMLAIFRNAVDANDWVLGSSTVPFCFRSYDYFTLTAAAVMSDKAGTERARRETKERVRVAAPGRQTFRLDTQADFEQAIVRARESCYTTTHPHPVERINPFSQNEIPASRVPRMLMSLQGDAANKRVFPDVAEGDVRLWPARMEGFNGYVEHFDGQAFQIPDNVEVKDIDPEGYILDNGAYQLPLGDNGQRSGGSNRAGGRGGGGGGGRNRGRGQGGSILGRNSANPIKIDMWFRPDNAAGQQTFFDLQGNDPDARIKFTREQNGEFRATVRDRTIQKPGGEVEEACVTVFQPPGGLWGAQNWYHFGMAYRGCKPEEVSIFVDGFKRGEARFQSTLTGSMSTDDLSFSVERADDWPTRGVAWVGREAIEFERTGNGFTVVTYPFDSTNAPPALSGRGRRGTPACPHAAGEVVQLFGYSNLVESQTKTGGIAIPRGGANLSSNLGPFSVASFAGNSSENVTLPGGGTLQFEVLNPNKPHGDELILTSFAGGGLDYRDSFQATGGYVLILGMPALTGPPTPATPYQVELAYYTSYSNGTLFGLQAVPNPPNPDFANQTGNIQIQTTRQLHYLRSTTPPSPYFCAVFPISVGVTNVTGYLTPKARQGQTQIQPEYVSLGVPDYDQIRSHLVEWIGYYHVDTTKNALLCDDVNRLNVAIGKVWDLLSVQFPNNPPTTETKHGIGRDWLAFRGQKNTDIFGYTKVVSTGGLIHTTAEDVTPVFHVVTCPTIGFNPSQTPNQPPSQIAGHPAAGWGDSVTLEAASGAVRKRFDVTWSRDEHVSFGESPGADFSQRQLGAGLEDNREQYTRLLKFPSGEMPRISRPAKGRAGGDVEGGFTAGRIDEIRVSPFQSDRFIVWDHSAMGLNASQATSTQTVSIQGISETANEIPIANCHWYLKPLFNTTQAAGSNQGLVVTLPDGRGIEYDSELTGLPNNDAGLVQIDDEIIAFRRIGRGAKGAPAILDCERGVMNTTAQKHGFGANVVFLDFLPVTMLNEAVSPTASVMNIASEQGFATTGGLLLIDRELVHYTELRGRSFAMPPILDEKGEESGGLFRGRFGTTAAGHDNESIVLEMPFRYWDRWAESQDNPEISFYQFAVNRPGAYFERFGYEERRPATNVQMVALVRTEQDVPWCTDPTRASPKLLRFESGLAENKGLLPVGRHGSAFEARFYIRYLGNSFDPITLTLHDWKTTPELRWAQVDYFDETQVLERESGR